jgi:hypothetical protein
MRRVSIAVALAASIWAASAEKPRLKRAALVAMEDSFDRRIKSLTDDPYLLMALCSRPKSVSPMAQG